jgi:hypothetical protein
VWRGSSTNALSLDLFPMIHLVHTLGGCGGTLLSRCLGVMPGAAVLSEVNPAAVNLFPHFDPLYQDEHWLHLLSPEDWTRFSPLDFTVPENFRDLAGVMHDRATQAGRHLILRDWNYIDYLGVPFNPQPPCRLTIYEALPDGVRTIATAFIRHPLDQWVSLCKHEELRPTLTPVIFCDGYLAFLRSLGSIPVRKYEDFVLNPEGEMRAICNDLMLPFEPEFLEKFHAFDAVTGDFTRLRETTISPPPKKPIPSGDLDKFHASESYEQVLRLTGYREELA